MQVLTFQEIVSSDHTSLLPAGSYPVCGRAGLGLSAAHLCARRGGVDPGAQPDHTGPHGPAPLPAGAAGNPAQTPVLQRVSSVSEMSAFKLCFCRVRIVHGNVPVTNQNTETFVACGENCVSLSNWI